MECGEALLPRLKSPVVSGVDDSVEGRVKAFYLTDGRFQSLLRRKLPTAMSSAMPTASCF